jgi:hypothetical protein
MAGLALVTVSRPAHADLRDVATRVVDAWTAAGGDVTRGESRFVLEDDTVTLDLRPPSSAACRRVALIGARGMSFHVTAASDEDGDGSFRVSSVAGVLELQGCGGGVPDHVKVKTDGGRGALESVVASAKTALPSTRTILLERTGGVLPPAPEPGPLPALAAPTQRALGTESRLAQDGFKILARNTWVSGDDGKGSHSLTLDEGCHRFDLFAEEPSHLPALGRHVRLDLDGTLRREDGELLADDQTAAPDVRLEVCVATLTKVTIAFEGSPRGTPVVATHAERILPDHLPRLWGPVARARFAAAILDHHLAAPGDDAVLLAQGASGVTPLPLELEPGGCYLLVAVLEHGRGHGIGIHVGVGARRFDDERGSKDDTAAATFCARQETRARVEVDARSAGAGWALAMFRMQGGAWNVGH